MYLFTYFWLPIKSINLKGVILVVVPVICVSFYRICYVNGSPIFVKLEDTLDKLIAEFESEKQVEVERDLRRQEKTANRFSNSKVRLQDDVDWEETKQDAESCPNHDCRHYYTMGIESRNEVGEVNDALKAEHQQLMRQYDDLSAAQKKEKKKPAKKDKDADYSVLLPPNALPPPSKWWYMFLVHEYLYCW